MGASSPLLLFSSSPLLLFSYSPLLLLNCFSCYDGNLEVVDVAQGVTTV
jgi:hypothetical protein